MKAMMLFITALFLLAGCGNNAAEETAAPAVVPQDIRIASVGDSLTQGVGDSTKSGGYVPYLTDQLESLDAVGAVTVDNFGKRGNRTDQLLKRLQTEEIQSSIQQSDMVIVTIGGNDVVEVMKNNWSNLTVDVFREEEDAYAERVEAILTEIRSINPDAGLVLVGIYNPFGRIFVETEEDEQIVKAWNSRAEQIAAGFDRSAFVSIESIFGPGSDSLFFEDQFHPNDAGYEQMAGRIFNAMRQAGLSTLTNGKIDDESGGSS